MRSIVSVLAQLALLFGLEGCTRDSGAPGAEGEEEGDGEREGEGEGELVPDVGGDRTNPQDIALPFQTILDLDSEQDEDCYRFAIAQRVIFGARTTGTCIE